ncbi:MAG TPA: outer membrane protein [Rhizobiaceae bacterium]
MSLCTPASAGDSSPGEIAASASFNWTGFYVGAHGGYGWGEGKAANPDTPGQEPEGRFGGLQIGYDHQFASNLLLGIVADVSYGKLDDAVLAGNYLGMHAEVDYLGTARVRAGYAIDRLLPYVTGGFAWAHSAAGAACPTGVQFGVCSHPDYAGEARKDNTVATGWTAGVGLDYAFADHWSANVEYLRVDYGTDTYDLDIFGNGDVKTNLDILRAGINYRF